MKTLIASITVTIGLLAPAVANSPSPGETPTPTPTIMGGCNHAGWNTEIYRFCGARESMIERVSNLPPEIVQRRVFAQITQGDSGAEIKLYERQASGSFKVTFWHKDETSDLMTAADRAIVTNKGVNCVGEQVKDVLLKELGQGTAKENVPAPATPAAAFVHSLKEAKGQYIQTIIIVLC